jgi:hypothetical protein
VAAVLQLPEIRERYLKGGFEPVANKPEEFAQQSGPTSRAGTRW